MWVSRSPVWGLAQTSVCPQGPPSFPFGTVGRGATTWAVWTDPASVSADSGGRTPGSSRRSSGPLCRKCPSHALSVTTPTSPRSRGTHSRPTTTPKASWIAQPLTSWTFRPGPLWRIRGLDFPASHAVQFCSLWSLVPFQASSVTPSLRAAHPIQALLFSWVSLHSPEAHLAQAQGQRLCLSSSPT